MIEGRPSGWLPLTSHRAAASTAGLRPITAHDPCLLFGSHSRRASRGHHDVGVLLRRWFTFLSATHLRPTDLDFGMVPSDSDISGIKRPGRWHNQVGVSAAAWQGDPPHPAHDPCVSAAFRPVRYPHPPSSAEPSPRLHGPSYAARATRARRRTHHEHARCRVRSRYIRSCHPPATPWRDVERVVRPVVDRQSSGRPRDPVVSGPRGVIHRDPSRRSHGVGQTDASRTQPEYVVRVPRPAVAHDLCHDCNALTRKT